MAAVKYDEEKIMADLLVPEFIEAVAEVMTQGAKKYAPNNWQGLKKNRILAALYRHLLAYHRGEMLDKESGLSHIAHIGANAMFLYWFEEVKK